MTPRNGEQPSTFGNGLPIATNVATPTTNLEDAPSPSLDSIAINFAMPTIIDYPTLEPSICKFEHVHTPTRLQGYINVVETGEEFINLMEIDDEPQNFQEVAKNPHWINAMEQEYCFLAHNETWILADLSHGCRPLSTKWVYHLKISNDNTLVKDKAHLVSYENE